AGRSALPSLVHGLPELPLRPRDPAAPAVADTAPRRVAGPPRQHDPAALGAAVRLAPRPARRPAPARRTGRGRGRPRRPHRRQPAVDRPFPQPRTGPAMTSPAA